MGIEGLKKMGSVTSTGGRGNHRGKDIFLNYSEEQKIFRYYISVFFRHHLHSGRFQIGRNRAWWIPHRKDWRLASLRGLGGGGGAGSFLLFSPFPSWCLRAYSGHSSSSSFSCPFLLTCLKPKRVAKPVLWMGKGKERGKWYFVGCNFTRRAIMSLRKNK